MLLRASGDLEGTDLDITAITHGGDSGVPDADLLIALVESVMARNEARNEVRNDERLVAARAQLIARLGAPALVDAAAVIGTFQTMDRVADATGIPLDAPVVALSHDLRDALALDQFASAQNTRRPGRLQRTAGAMLVPLITTALRLRRALRRKPRQASRSG